ncbi:hypothetical protein HID58_069852, partial [Brassica napus]
FSATKLCRCIDVRRLRRRLRIVSASSPSSSPHHLRRRLRIASVFVCASPPSSSAHRLRRRLRIASASSLISPHLRIASALSPIRFRHYKLAFYDDVVSKKEDRMMMTRLHTVVDTYFVKCGSYVRWR